MSQFDRIYNVAQMTESTVHAEVQATAQVLTPVMLTRTDEPVWIEDEQAEARGWDADGIPLIPPLEPDEADAAVAAARVQLPDVLLPQRLATEDGQAKSADPPISTYVGELIPHFICVPTSFDAPENLVLRRLRLELTFTAFDQVQPLVLWLSPTADVTTTDHEVAEVGVDLGKLVSLLAPIPDIFTAKAHSTMSVTGVNPRIQASGPLIGQCHWRVSDPKLCYDFTPRVVFGARPPSPVMVGATLHVEIRKSILGIFHRTYAKSAQPRQFALSWKGGHLISPQVDPGPTERSTEGSSAFADVLADAVAKSLLDARYTPPDDGQFNDGQFNPEAFR